MQQVILQASVHTFVCTYHVQGTQETLKQKGQQLASMCKVCERLMCSLPLIESSKAFS